MRFIIVLSLVTHHSTGSLARVFNLLRKKPKVFSEGRWCQALFKTSPSQTSLDFENDFDLYRDIARERTHADGAAGADAGFFSPDLGEELRAAVDDLGMISEVGHAVDHAEHFDDSFDAVETAEFCLEGGQ